MFPPGGNNPNRKMLQTMMSRNRPGALQPPPGGQTQATPAMETGAPGQPGPPISVGDHLAEALRGIFAGEPGALESLQAFTAALQKAAIPFQGQESQGARPTGFPAVAPNSAQGAPIHQGPLG